MDDMELLSIAEKYFLGDVNIAKIWFKKYGINGETPVDIWKRLAKLTSETEKEEKQKEWDSNFYDLLKDWKFVPGGRILFALTEDIKNKTGRRKITPFNCFVLPSPEDNLESIFDIVQKGRGADLRLKANHGIVKIPGFTHGYRYGLENR